ncbi:methyl-accepting chemotaxis protein [Sporomusa sp.]|uniref:methyl-accepting chemotaxis protein n=1 Tax=Sporomusa sp. TaxID=2078658 RepID=UPI002CA0995C|nr:methyl-accepting chemotaxis protein [Sporomusa sp.]HWR42619.1 methyl-accepting chemotaxis protein [Sporomusa sp.]
MKWFRNCKIGVKLTIAFFVLVLITGITGVVGVRQIQQMEKLDAELYENNTVSLGDIGAAGVDFQRIRVNLGQLILAESKEQRQQYAKIVVDLNVELEQDLDQFGKTIRSEEIRREFYQLKAIKAKWDVEREELVRLVLSGEGEKAKALHVGAGNASSLEINGRIDKLTELITVDAKRKADTNVELAKDAVREMLVLLLVSILIATALAWFITRQITQPVHRLRTLMAEVEKGDLTVQGQVCSKDEIGQLVNSFNQLIGTIRTINIEIQDTTIVLNNSSASLLAISEVVATNSEETSAITSAASWAVGDVAAGVRNTAEAIGETSSNIYTISAATEEISTTIQSLASASEQASVGLSQVNGLMEQVSGSIQVVSHSAKDVSGSVSDVAAAIKEINISLNEISRNCESSIHVAEDAQVRARETTVIITNLNGLSKQIGKIVNLINDIADQTNMLALNAAIEAAGAGEAGRGFAVVANEVKELARKTAGATDDISMQIETMQTEMANGVQAMERITQVISEINQKSGNIAAAVTEQSAVVGEISTAVIKASEKVNLITGEIEDIADKSQSIASSTTETYEGVCTIARSVHELALTAGEVAKNTDRASGRMGEVAKTSQAVAEKVEEISNSISEISKASNDTAAKGTVASQSADDLVEVAAKLEGLSKQFKI